MSVWLTLAGAGAALDCMFAPRTLRRVFLATSMLVAVPVLMNSLGCGRARDASDYDDDEDERPRKKWYCAPSDVTACFETRAACRERAKYLPGTPECETAQNVYCYTHDLYLNVTYACFARMQECAGDQSIAKGQEEANQGTYYNVSKCKKR